MSAGSSLFVKNIAERRPWLALEEGSSFAFVNPRKLDRYRKCLQASETKVGGPLWALGTQPHPRKLLDHFQNGDLAL